jgi:hypothetical protein
MSLALAFVSTLSQAAITLATNGNCKTSHDFVWLSSGGEVGQLSTM